MLAKPPASMDDYASDRIDQSQHLSQCQLRPLNGRNIAVVPSIISRDGKYLLCCSGRDICVFSLKDNKRVHTLVGHTDDVTDIVFNPDNQFQVISSSLDGSMKKWDLVDAVLISTVHPSYITKKKELKRDPSFCVYRMFSLGNQLQMIFLLKNGEDCWLVKQKPMFETFTHSNILWKSLPKLDPDLIDVGCGGEMIAIADISPGSTISAFWAMDLKTNKRERYCGLQQWQSSFGNGITALAAHPHEKVVAAGLQAGRIFIASQLLQSTQAVLSYIHWHMYPVRALCFSPEGFHLYSGGSEAAVVKWNTDSLKGDKSVFGRLGSAINSIRFSPDSSTVVLGCADNSVKMLKAKTIDQVIQEICEDHVCGNNSHYPAGIQVNPGSGTLVMNGVPGHLQFYSPSVKSIVYNLDITNMNYYQTGDFPTIDHVAISPHGKWMVTFERWAGQLSHVPREISEQCRLKFWKFNDTLRRYQLNTDVDRSHIGGVSFLRFSPLPDDSSSDDCSVLLSAGVKDQSFKIWSLNILEDDKDQSWWSVEKSGDYRLGATDADFSDDCTILAMAFGRKVTLWDVDSLNMMTSLSHRSDILSVKFSRGKSCQLLAVMGMEDTVIWDLLTFTECQRIQGQGLALCVDPVTSHFVAITKSTGFIFSKQGILGEFRIPRKFSKIHSATFISKSTDDTDAPSRDISGRLHFVTRDGYALELTDQSKTTTPAAEDMGKRLISSDPSLSVTALGALLNVRKAERDDSTLDTVESTAQLLRDKMIEQIGETSCIAMPNVSTLCDSFLRCLISGKKKTLETEQRSSEANGDGKITPIDSDDDDMTDDNPPEEINTTHVSHTKSTSKDLKLITFDLKDFQQIHESEKISASHV